MAHDFWNRLRAADLPVVVDVGADWCPPCRQIEPHMERLAEEYEGRVEMWDVDSDEQPDVARALGVRGIPTLIVFQGDTEITRRVGAMPPNQLRELFEAALTGTPPDTVPTSAGGRTKSRLSPLDRSLRLAAGLALLWFAWTRGQNWLLMLIGAIVVLSAVHDLLPSISSLVSGSPSEAQGDSEEDGQRDVEGEDEDAGESNEKQRNQDDRPT